MNKRQHFWRVIHACKDAKLQEYRNLVKISVINPGLTQLRKRFFGCHAKNIAINKRCFS